MNSNFCDKKLTWLPNLPLPRLAATVMPVYRDKANVVVVVVVVVVDVAVVVVVVDVVVSSFWSIFFSSKWELLVASSSINVWFSKKRQI